MLLLRSSTSVALVLSCLFRLAIIDDCSSFSATTSSQLTIPSSVFQLDAVSVSTYTEDEYAFDANGGGGGGVFLMNRAQACADSETCSLEDAQMFLDGVLHQQKECIGSGVLSTKTMICDNVENTIDLVATLRYKIDTAQRRRALVTPTVHTINVVLGIYAVSTILHGVAAVPNVPIDAPLFYNTDSYSSLFEQAGSNRGIVPFLPEEWIWAIRDGYFPRMVMEFVHNGGLVVDTTAFDTKAVAITPQEWIWSLQNGSFGRLLEENMRYGGFVVDSTSLDSTDTIPMTGRDILFSIRDGYFGTAMSHFYRNGGL